MDEIAASVGRSSRALRPKAVSAASSPVALVAPVPTTTKAPTPSQILLLVFMSNPDDDFQDFAVPYVTPCPRLHARLVSRLRSSQALAVHSHANFGIKGTLASSYASSLDMRRNFKSTTLVSRFRSSHHCAAASFANFGIEGH